MSQGLHLAAPGSGGATIDGLLPLRAYAYPPIGAGSWDRTHGR